MDTDPSHPSYADQMQQLAAALNTLRDALTLASLTLNDLLTDCPSPERDATLAAVQTYLRQAHALTHAKDEPANGGGA